MIDKDKLIDLLLRIYFVNKSPAVGGAFVMAWAHGMEYQPGLTFHEQFADMCEELGLPRELPDPEYPEQVWAAYKVKDGMEYHELDAFEEVYSGTVMEVHEWAQQHEGQYHHVGSTNRTVETEQKAFEKWKAKILKDANISK